MITPEDLLEEARLLGISVHREPMLTNGFRALYLRWTDQAVILHNARNDTELLCLLAEEIGHHRTGPQSRIKYQTVEDLKSETRARRWAHNRILPVKRVLEAKESGLCEKWELAEFLGVTEPFLEEAIMHYRQAGLME